MYCTHNIGTLYEVAYQIFPILFLKLSVVVTTRLVLLTHYSLPLMFVLCALCWWPVSKRLSSKLYSAVIAWKFISIKPVVIWTKLAWWWWVIKYKYHKKFSKQIGAGLSRTGTSSLKVALKQLLGRRLDIPDICHFFYTSKIFGE